MTSAHFAYLALLLTQNPMSLKDAYRRALAESESVEIAERDVDEADLRWSATYAEWGPSVALHGSGTVQRRVLLDDGTEFLPEKVLEARATFDQPLFRLSFFDAYAARRADHGRAEATLARTREQLMHDVAAVFVGLLRARKLVEVAQAALERAQVQYDHAKARVGAGGALKNAELLAKIELERARFGVVNAKSAARAAEFPFQRIVGEAPPAELALEPTPQLVSMEEAMKRAAERNDVQSLRLMVMVAEAEEERTASKRLWPLLDLRGAASVTEPEVFEERFNWSVLGVLTIPLLQSGSEYSAIDLSANETQRAQLRVKQQLELAAEEIRVAANRVQTAEESAAVSKDQVGAALESYQLVEAQFRLGGVTFLEVATAQAALTEAETLREVTAFERELAVYDFLFATGMLSL